MRRRLALHDHVSRLALLVHGDYGAGKTTLLADALVSMREYGPVYYLNVAGEDGYLSLTAFPEPPAGETIETVEDYRAALKECRERQVVALAVDSLKALYRVVSQALVSGRIPMRDDYAAIHYTGEGLVADLRATAPLVLVACPSDKSVHQLSGRTLITPDLPGRAAVGCAGWFDLVGYLSAETVGRGQVRRVLTFAPSATIVTRARLARPLVEDLVLPQGPGSWRVITEALAAHGLRWAPPTKGGA